MKQSYMIPEKWLEEPVEIALIGAGGTGSELLDGLARMSLALGALGHPGFEVTVWDDDTVSATNVLRQRFLPADVGQSKAQVMVTRYNAFLGTRWRAVTSRFDTGQVKQCDLLITCVDKAALRVAIGKRAARGTGEGLWLDTGNDRQHGQICLGHIGRPEGLRLPTIYDLYPELAENASTLDVEGPSCSAEEALTRQEFPVNRQSALCALSLLWALFRHGRIDHHGYYFHCGTGHVDPLPIDERVWASLGYTVAA